MPVDSEDAPAFELDERLVRQEGEVLTPQFVERESERAHDRDATEHVFG